MCDGWMDWVFVGWTLVGQDRLFHGGGENGVGCFCPSPRRKTQIWYTERMDWVFDGGGRREAGRVSAAGVLHRVERHDMVHGEVRQGMKISGSVKKDQCVFVELRHIWESSASGSFIAQRRGLGAPNIA